MPPDERLRITVRAADGFSYEYVVRPASVPATATTPARSSIFMTETVYEPAPQWHMAVFNLDRGGEFELIPLYRITAVDPFAIEDPSA